MGRAKRLNFRVFLEGLEVPFESGSVTIRRNAPTQATVNLAPSPAIYKICPRTVCQIVYFDQEDRDWHLLFDGEVIGRGRTKTERSRQVSVIAEGVSNYWFRAYLYMLNEATGLTYGSAIKVQATGASKPYLAHEKWMDISSLLEGQIEKSFKSLAGRVPEINNFYKTAESRLHVVDRIITLDDPQIIDLFIKRTYFDRIYEVLIRDQVSEQAPIMAVMKGLMDLLHYDYQEMPSPQSMAGQMIFKPTPYFCPVPQCNIFFPARTQSFAELRDFMAEPTRLMLTTNLFRDRGVVNDAMLSSIVRYAPKELQAMANEINRQGIVNVTDEEVAQRLKELHSTFLTEEENIKGIIPDYAKLTTSEWLSALGANEKSTLASTGTGEQSGLTFAGTDEEFPWLGNIVNYKYLTRKFESRSMSIHSSFHPWVAVGFPGALLDESGHVFGIVNQATHQFSCRSGAATGIQLGYMMCPGDKDIPGLGEVAFPALPPWFSTQYATGGAYGTLLGSPTVGGSAEECAAQLDSLFKSFRKSKHVLDYCIGINRRPVVTMGDALGYSQALGVQGPIVDHVKYLSGSRSFAGF